MNSICTVTQSSLIIINVINYNKRRSKGLPNKMIHHCFRIQNNDSQLPTISVRITHLNRRPRVVRRYIFTLNAVYCFRVYACVTKIAQIRQPFLRFRRYISVDRFISPNKFQT